MDFPLMYKLKRQSQKDLAELQDEVVEVVYEVLDDAVIHGGTAVWRCYGSKRFSKDIDLYAVYREGFKETLETALKKRGLTLVKFRQTTNTLFSEVSDGRSTVKLEITRKRVKGTLTIYKKANGNSMDVLTLEPKELILEKFVAYKNRREVRDIYDVYFLSRFVDDTKTKRIVRESLDWINNQVDVADLKTIVYEGKVPSFTEMIEKIRIWAK